MKLLIIQSSPVSCHFLSLTSECSHQQLSSSWQSWWMSWDSVRNV